MNNEQKLQNRIERLRIQNRNLNLKVKELKEKIKVVCIGVKCPDYKETKESLFAGIMSVDISEPKRAFHSGWEMAMLDCGEILSRSD